MISTSAKYDNLHKVFKQVLAVTLTKIVVATKMQMFGIFCHLRDLVAQPCPAGCGDCAPEPLSGHSVIKCNTLSLRKHQMILCFLLLLLDQDKTYGHMNTSLSSCYRAHTTESDSSQQERTTCRQNISARQSIRKARADNTT